ncbi:MAG: hypothetical protein K8T91_05415 [Planctomycetes bacterium]|nr:hypothetical protein [Planctomycetota bacterium]
MSDFLAWFTDDPTPILIGGGLALAILAAIVYFTGRAAWMFGMGIVVAIMGLALLTDFLIVTDRELINEVIAEGATALKSNQLDNVMRLVSPSANELQRLARDTMQSVKFKDVRVTTTPKIVVNQLTTPKTAIARFAAVADVGTTSGTFKVPRRVEVHFEWQKDRWLVSHADWSSIIGGDGNENEIP